MAGEAKGGKPGSRGRGRRKNPSKSARGDLTYALNHEVRRDILRFLHSSSGSCSSGDIAEQLNQTPGRIGYHLLVLRRRGAVALVDAEAVRNTVKHFYASKVESHTTVLDFLEKTRKSDLALALKRDDKKKNRAS